MTTENDNILVHKFLKALLSKRFTIKYYNSIFKKGIPLFNPERIWTYDRLPIGGEIYDFSIIIEEYEIENILSSPQNIDYRSYLQVLKRDFLRHIRMIPDTRFKYDTLKEILSELEIHLDEFTKEIIFEGWAEGQQKINDHFEIELIPLDKKKFIEGCYFRQFTSIILSHQKELIETTIRALSKELSDKKYEKLFNQSDATQMNLESSSTINWTKSDTDLLELIIALYEYGAIQNTTKDLTQKDAIMIISSFFGKDDIKDVYKKLNAARMRKKEERANFLSRLAEELNNYYKKQDEKSLK